MHKKSDSHTANFNLLLLPKWAFSIKYIKSIWFRWFFFGIARFCTSIPLHFIAKIVKDWKIIKLQICKKKIWNCFSNILLLFIQYLRQREVQYFISILRANYFDHWKFSLILGLIIFHKNSTISKCFFGRLWIKRLSSKSLMILKYKYIWPQNMHWKVILNDNLLKYSKFNPHLPKMLIKYLFFPECLAQSHFLCITL